MQASLAEQYDVVQETYAEASEQLQFDLWELVQSGPAETLGETVNTQPAMLVAGIATWRIYQSVGGKTPAVVAGHSLGEYAALVAADCLEFSVAVKLVRRRAELMQNAVPAGQGAMAAVLGLDDDAVASLCESVAESGVAEAVNFNAPGQVVVAGDRAAIDKLVRTAKDAGAKRALPLPVSVPAHSSLMKSAADELAASLAAVDFRAPSNPVVSTVDAKPYIGADDIRARLGMQIYRPVQWVETVRACATFDVDRFVECGPGKVLSGLVKRVDRSLSVCCIDSPDVLESIIAEQ